MADIDIKSSDSSNNVVRFRSTGTSPLPPSAGKPVAVTGASVHGTVMSLPLSTRAYDAHGYLRF